MAKRIKKYFVKDESLKTVDNDFFRHQDIADNLKKIIDTTEAPFNIAIIGKWGLGKSSLINLVLDPMKKKKENYIVQEINAWKYEKDEIGKAFLKQLWQGISGERLTAYSIINKEFSRVISEGKIRQDSEENSKPKGYYKKTIKSLWKPCSIILIISLFLYSIYAIADLNYNNVEIEKASLCMYIILNYCKNIVSFLFVPILVWFGKIYLDNYNAERHKRIEVSYPIESKDDYEIYIENKMKKVLEKNPNVKIITVIDDLDRLSADKMIEALDTLKIFMNFKQCVFIVPFDDEILKRVLDSKKNEGIAIDENRVIQSELILDKLFQYKIYLPQLIKGDIKSYAVSICRSDCQDFISEYIEDKLLERIVRNILVHSDVTTPRQVKKIVNVFINNVMIARSREEAGKVEVGFSTSEERMKLIAKLSVLQSDFNEFYDLLFEDSNVIYDIVESHRSSTLLNPIIKSYFLNEDENYKIKKQYLPLINFLINTEKYNNELLFSYLYMAQDEIAVLTGDKRQQDFIAAAENKNFKTVKDLVEESPVLLKSLHDYLMYSDDYDSLDSIIITSIEIFDVISEDYKLSIADAISERLTSILNFDLGIHPEEINFANLVGFMKISNNDKPYKELIGKNLDANIKVGEISRHTSMITDLLLGLKYLDENLRSKFARKINIYIKDKKSDINQIIKWKKLLIDEDTKKYLGLDYFKKICNYLIDENDFSEEIIGAFQDGVQIFISEENINDEIYLFEKAFSYPALHKNLLNILDGALFSAINVEKSSELAAILIAIDKENLVNETFSLLSSLTYKVEESDKTKYDTFFKEQLSQTKVADMLIAYVKHNVFTDIPLTIKELIANTFTKGYGNDIKLLLKFFDDNQVSSFWSGFKSYFLFDTSKDYTEGISVFGQLYEDKIYTPKLLAVFEETILPNLKTRYSYKNYFEIYVKLTTILNNDLSEGVADKYAEDIVSIMDFCVEDSISILRMIFNKNSEESFVNYIEKVLKKVNEDNFKDIYYMVNQNKSLFTKENSNLNSLVNFYILNLKNTDNPIKLIDDLNKKFGFINIGSVEDLIRYSLELKLDADKLNPIVNKFYNELPSNKESLDVLLGVLSEGGDNYKNIFDLLKGVDILHSENLKTIISTNTYSEQKLLQICKFLLMDSSSVDVSLILFIVDIIVSETQNVESNKNSLICLQQLRGEAVKSFKTEYTDLMKKIFNNTTSNEIKKMVVDIVRVNKLVRPFRTLLNDDESKEYSELIK